MKYRETPRLSLHMEIVWDFQLVQFESVLVLLVYIILSLQ